MRDCQSHPIRRTAFTRPNLYLSRETKSAAATMMRSISVLLLVFLNSVLASFCGDSAIPYSFEVLSDGQPILGCARPSCFGWDTSGLPASHTASFYQIHKKPDGFLRKERASIPPFEAGDVHFYHPQVAACEESFGSMTCDQDDQWVGGIAPLLNVSSAPTALQCCQFEPLKLSVDRGIATVAAGQIVVGGEASKKGKQFAFDYISGLSKSINADGTVFYEVNIRRFPCLALPASKVFQAPVTSVENPIPIQENVIEGPFNEDGSRETNVQAATPPSPSTQLFQSQIEPQTQLVQGQVPQPQLISAQVQPAVPLPAPVPAPPPVQPFFQPALYVPYYSPTTPYYCFSADTTVRTIDNGQKRMDELKAGEWIQTIEENQMVFSQVKLWLHRNPEQLAVFHKLTLEDGKTLKLTGKHFIFKTICTANSAVPVADVSYEAIFAETVMVGDCLYVEDELKEMRKVKVLQVEKVKEKGIYSPLVSQGKLMVNGILASCHSVVQSNTLQQTFFGYVDYFFMWTQWLFGSVAEDIRELPIGMDLITSLMDEVLPHFNLVTK